jgi:hypothetical protein
LALSVRYSPRSARACSILRPELDALLRTAFFLSGQLYDELLQAAGEIDS